MQRSPAQRLSLIAALLLALAPTGIGLARYFSSRGDLVVLWMAIVATLFTGGVLAAAVGRRRSRHAVNRQAAIILGAATLLAGATGYMFGHTAGPGIWAVAFAFALSLSAASVCVALARPRAS